MARRIKEEEQQFEDLSSYSSEKEYKKRRKNKGSHIVLKSIGAVLCVLLIAFGGVLIYISTDLLEGLTTTSITKDPAELGINAEEVIMDNSIKNIALFGVDSRSGEFSGQSDVIMILTVDNRHHALKMTSILRDSRVPIEGETLDGEYLDYWDTKINAAYAYGGPKLAIRTLNQNFGLDISDYVTINFTNMAAIVDAFGGVEMEVTGEEVQQINQNLWALSQEVEDEKRKDEANGTYQEHNYPNILHSDFIPDVNGTVDIQYGEYQGGKLLLNGNQAVAYGRIRYLEGGDFGRAQRQQKVFTALVGKVKTLSFSDYPNLIKQLVPYCETSFEDLGDIVGLTPILTGNFTIQSINVPDAKYETDLFDGKAEDDIWYYIYDVTPAAKRISSFIYEDASPYWDEYGNTAQSVVQE